MKRRKWYLKKRMILLVLVFLFILIGRLEFAKMRYDPDRLIASLTAATSMPPKFAVQMHGTKSLHFLQMGQRPFLPNIVLVHGSPGALNAYERYLKDTLLLQKANLVAVDRPGFGYSDFGEAELSLEEQAERIVKVLKVLPATKKVLVGHSMGGPVISKIAMMYPELVDGLVLIAPSISPALEPSNTWRKWINFLPFRWLSPPALRVCNQEIIPLKKELEGMMDDWEKLKIPVTVIQGTEDVLVPEGNADFADKMLTQSTDVKIRKIEGGDHFILWSEIPLIKGEILELLGKL